MGMWEEAAGPSGVSGAGRRVRVRTSLVIVGALFTLVGVASLLIPGSPVFCFGALIFGPILLLRGLTAQARRSLMYPPPQYQLPPFDQREAHLPPSPGTPQVAATAASRTCPNCGASGSANARFCTVCGARLPEAP